LDASFLKSFNSFEWLCITHKILSSTIVINIDIKNVSSAENQQIRTIPEGSCDTEDWKFKLCLHRNK